MKMKLDSGMLYIKDANPVTQEPLIKSWSLMKWNRKMRWFEGIVCRELLNRLRSMTALPPSIEAERVRLNRIQDAVDKERMLPSKELRPLTAYPVTRSLYEHQVRAANMALLTFGLTDPEEVLSADHGSS
jgi:hypothetical protein